MSVDGVAMVLARALTDPKFEEALRSNARTALTLTKDELSAEEYRLFSEPKRLTADEMDQINATGFTLATYGSAFAYVNRNIGYLSQEVRKQLNAALSGQDLNLMRAVPCTGWD